MLEAARRHRERTGRNLFADVLAAELADGSRVVTSSEHWMAFVPFAARWPVEVHLYPRRAGAGPAGAWTRRRARRLRPTSTSTSCAASTASSTPRCRTSRPGTRPRRTSTATCVYLHLEVFSIRRAPDKLKFLAGSESGMGAFVNDIAPERAAAMLRDAMPR